jgi:ribulose-5-phosphate 4-epimerase/fuculose-1-phosphate aldolase
MGDVMANHLSSHVPGELGAFLVNRYGMRYEEITASSLIKIDLDGNILAKPDFGTLDHTINRADPVIHGAIHPARREVACVIHTRCRASVAVHATPGVRVSRQPLDRQPGSAHDVRSQWTIGRPWAGRRHRPARGPGGRPRHPPC